MSSRLPHVIVMAALLSACQDPVDQAAKRRIFSPEDPPKVLSSAQEKLPPEEVASTPRVSHRVLSMEAGEVVERLGPHVYTADVSYEWTGAGAPVRLTEQRRLVAGPRGVGGDFQAVLDNSRDQGLEVLRVDGKVYARNRYGKFRQRLRDRGMAERTRAEVQGVMRDVDALFLGRLALAPQGTETVQGRTAWKYALSLAPAGRAGLEAGPQLPGLLEPKGKRDAATERRLRFFETREPVALEGEVWVDAETSVVLKSRVDGKLRVPAHGEEGPSELRLQVKTALADIGKGPALKPPEDFLPDADKPQGIADALDRFGIPRVREGADGGTSSEAPEPAEEE